MESIQGIFTKRPIYNLASTGIRLALPHTVFKIGECSHSIVVDGAHAIEAKMFWLEGRKFCTGVRRVRLEDALAGSKIVASRHYTVPDAAAGLAWARDQVGKGYDFKGAVGLSVAPGRDWQDDDLWFCHELLAATVHAAGRILFGHVSHITSRELLAVAP